MVDTANIVKEASKKLIAKSNFTALDFVVMAAYILAILGMGIWFSIAAKKAKETNSDDYFTGGSKIPTWVIGFSIWATTLSAITFIALPANAYNNGWLFAFSQLTIIIFAPVLIKFVIPFFRRMKESTAYAYLHARFHYALRAFSSILFILFHIFRMGIVLYIPANALSLVVPLDPWVLVIIMGVVVVITTYLGGQRGVLWQDAIQGIILLLGIVLIIVFSLYNIFGTGNGTNGKESIKYAQLLKASDLHVTLVGIGIPLILVSRYIEVIYTYVGGQDVVQRYKASKKTTNINKSIWINAGLALITILLFYGAGSALYTYYDGMAITQIDPAIKHTNQLVPYFIFTVLPTGIAGLIISAVFAASQSTMSSSLSSLVNSIIVDFVKVFAKKFSNNEKKLFLLSKILIGAFGAFGVICGIAFTLTNLGDIINYFLGVVGLFGAPTAAIFMLGMFTKRTSWISALIGMVTGFLVGLIIWIFSTPDFVGGKEFVKFNSGWVGVFGFFVTLLVGYLTSFIFPNKKNITNLSWHTLTPEFKELIALEKTIEKAAKKKQNADKEILRYDELIRKLEMSAE
ncbi:sodium:solute symporter family transporter [Mycoplasmopsis alligatoris]|uniref:Transporter, SSS family n=1 Tax=Mycoplasmopsis alligatoris A21JP2 TaxID=747682 RepID=D4XVE0_9BACT|nr:sodium/solute symporter [Mycoplasmopsis alligatoris]EFF41606.1 transporter, SSS family [Mycoplasmopsis alligatoris A21JP2]